jgi:hypothetical protein
LNAAGASRGAPRAACARALHRRAGYGSGNEDAGLHHKETPSFPKENDLSNERAGTASRRAKARYRVF